MFRDPRGLLRDERGARSAARVLLMAVVGYTLPLILGDALGWIAVGTDAYTLLGGLVTILGAWAGGPRAMQYLGPQVGAVLSRVGGGRRGYSGPEVSVRVGEDPATDDERG